MPLGGRLEKNQSDEKAARGVRGALRARKRATPLVPLSQMARNERLNNGTGDALSMRNKNYERDDDEEETTSRETSFRPNILSFFFLPATTHHRFAVKLSMKSLHFENIPNPEVD